MTPVRSFTNSTLVRFVCFGLALVVAAPSDAAVLPTGFFETAVASGLQRPTAMAFAPDGRLFIAEQAGGVRVVSNGVLLSTPFVTLAVNSSGERGVLGIAFDPAFAVNRFVYVYYTATTPVIHNRVSRFTANGNVAAAGSEVFIVDLEPLTATNHNGGAIHFGPDGMLYIAVGDNAVGSNAETVGNRLGKILRIGADGSIPADNPFVSTAVGANAAIWAMGLRNPFTFAFQAGTNAMFINDVGENTWEEINQGIAGANYGWPSSEGATPNPSFVSPLYAYSHSDGCAISGGAFYNPPTAALPVQFAGSYFFADFCGGWIRRRLPGSGTVASFATGISSPVDLQVSADGALYYLARGSGSTTGVVYRIASATPTVNVTAGGLDGPVILSPTARLRITAAFHAGTSATLAPAEVYFAVVTELGVFWWNPATQAFETAVVPMYSGPVPAFQPLALIDLPSAAVLPPGSYWWVLIVDNDSNRIPNGRFVDFVQTIR